nr:hypothetical protein [uncultured Albidiferax sp.]
MSGNMDWLDTMRARGFGRRVAAIDPDTDTSTPSITPGTSAVRLSMALRQMRGARTEQELTALKESAIPGLTARDVFRLTAECRVRGQHLRNTQLPKGDPR